MADTNDGIPNIGLAALPNQRHKIVSVNGATLTIMLAGKSTLALEHYSPSQERAD